MKIKLNAKEFSDVLWLVGVLAAMICLTALGRIDVPSCLAVGFVMLLNLWNVVDAAQAREKAETEQAKMKERLDEAERLLAEFYEEFGIQETPRINYRAYKNKYLR